MRSLQSAASALETALQDLLAIFHSERATPEVVASLQDRCALLTTQLVEATTSSTSSELDAAAPALRRAQRLNAIARGVVERQREAAGTLIASAQRARRTLGGDAPVADGTSCDVQA
jgi:hypothetical protein